MSEKKRGFSGRGKGGDGDRPKIPSSHHTTGFHGADLPKPKRAGGQGGPRKSRPGPGASQGPLGSRGGGGPRVRKARTQAQSAPTASIASDASRELAIWIATAALDKKALSVEVLDVSGKVDYADFLVLMTGRSDRQVQAIAQGIEEALRKKGRRPQSVEGLPHATWVLMDFSDVVVHVFQDEARGAYDLEGLWMDARRIPVPMPDGETEH